MDRLADFPPGQPPPWLTSAAATCVAVVVLLYAIYWAALPKPIPGIPYNEAATRRLFGDITDMFKAKSRRQWIWRQPEMHGAPIAQIMLLPFTKPTVVISDYRETVDICSRRLREFDRGTRVQDMVCFTAPEFHFALQSRDPKFRFHRELLRDLMTPAFLHEISAPRVYDRATRLVELWDLKRRKAQGRPFKADHDLYLAALDIICSVAFGMEDSKAALHKEASHTVFADGADPATKGCEEPFDFDPVEPDPEIAALLDIPDMMALGQRAPFPNLAQYIALLKPEHAKGWYYRRALIKRQIVNSLKKLNKSGMGSRESALDQLLWREMCAAERAGREPEFFSPIIRDEILGFLLGGHDTSATVLAWWVKHMAAHQSVQARLRIELRRAHAQAVKEQRPPTIDEINRASIPYLDAVIEETLRLNSVVAILVRRATCDTQILGYRIPKGTDIMMPTTGPSITEPSQPIPESLRSPGAREAKDRVPAWPEDDIGEFKPDRWLKRERVVQIGQTNTTSRCSSRSSSTIGTGYDSSSASSTSSGTEDEDEDDEDVCYDMEEAAFSPTDAHPPHKNVVETEVFDPMAGPELPFSTGPRGCFGKKLALVQLRTQATLLMWNFEFSAMAEGLNTFEVTEKMVNTPKECFVKLKKI